MTRERWVVAAGLALLAAAVILRRRRVVKEWAAMGPDGRCWMFLRRADGTEESHAVDAAACQDLGGGSSSGGGAGTTW